MHQPSDSHCVVVPGIPDLRAVTVLDPIHPILPPVVVVTVGKRTKEEGRRTKTKDEGWKAMEEIFL